VVAPFVTSIILPFKTLRALSFIASVPVRQLLQMKAA
jgi:hypothetical protein